MEMKQHEYIGDWKNKRIISSPEDTKEATSLGFPKQKKEYR